MVQLTVGDDANRWRLEGHCTTTIRHAISLQQRQRRIPEQVTYTHFCRRCYEPLTIVGAPYACSPAAHTFSWVTMTTERFWSAYAPALTFAAIQRPNLIRLRIGYSLESS